MSESDPHGEIEFVYFDLGNVLLAFDPAIACRNVSERFGVSFLQAQAAVYDSGLQHRFECGALTGPSFAESIRQQLGRSENEVPTSELLDAVSDMFTPIDSMAGVMRSVQCGGYRVGLLSNTCQAHWDWILRQHYDVMDFDFEVTVLSFEVGSMKPDPEIYDAAERLSGATGGQILFLDDRRENVAAALDRGWQAHQVLGGPESIDALRRSGLLGEVA